MCRSAAASAELVKKLEGTCQWFKVGMELFTAAGPTVIEPLVEAGHSVFLDLKFHDIPNTVAGAVRSAATLGVRMVNVHAAGGPAMLAAARAALEGVTNPPELLAVTVLTSMDAAALKAAGVDRSPAEQVELLAKMCIAAGIRGLPGLLGSPYLRSTARTSANSQRVSSRPRRSTTFASP